MKIKFTSLLVLACGLLLVSSTIDLNDLFNYSGQAIPNYISKDNTPLNNEITDAGATLGRGLFYDKNLSTDNTIACASCHKQEFAFGDTALVSTGVAGVTGRHSMRLVNARFADENRFFWDERANTLERQTTMPIQDHVEMGFSGEDGDPSLDSLIRKLEAIPYYQELFNFVYGSPQITEPRMRRALAQFVRSIQSFDSKYDAGRAQVNNNFVPFPNFTQQENMGKNLFMRPPPQGGAGCQGCHRAPEFDIAPNSRNNGVIGVAGDPAGIDLTVTRAPSLRDLVNPNGGLNGPLMHTGDFNSLLMVINHYNDIQIDTANTNLDPRLRGGPAGNGQNLQLTQTQKDALAAFLRTLTGADVYTNEKWSDPFDEDGSLTVLPLCATDILTSVNATICEGEIFAGYAQSGIYEDTFTGEGGCDSIRTLTLTVLPNAETTIEAVICEGDNFAGFELPGVYTETFQSATGCDSTRILMLEVLPVPVTFAEAEICAGQEYEGYSETGVYADTFTGSNGCDSIRMLELTVLPEDDPACTVSAVGDEISDSRFQVSPNPFDGFLRIGCDCELELEVAVFNLVGARVAGQRADFRSGALLLQTGHLRPGIYLVIGFDETGRRYFSKKLVNCEL
ncbi:MAG TPA: hypothetical protein ENJ95_02680 [Bacteroidetes bacterium]|nr:hypothetical protein [Bacteroidota bacterium]